jgi:23S rRNA pseudoU1915 N3-methylase RlmH
LDFIPINSIADIDPEKISIRDINKRYIDRDGNKYATRFNLQSRKVEVVRIVKTRAEAQRVSQQIKKERNEDRRAQRRQPDSGAGFDASEIADDSAPPPSPDLPEPEIPDFDDLESDELAPSDLVGSAQGARAGTTAAPGPDMHSGVFIEQHLIDDIVSHLSRCKEGQQVVINNLKNSRCFEGTANELNDLLREIDVDCWQASESAINYYKELYGYPRSVAQYIIRLTPEERERVEALPDDAERMEVIRRLETRRAFEELYKKIHAMTDRILALIASIPEDTKSQLMAAQRQQLEDAQASTEILLAEINEKLQQIEQWKKRYY